MLVVIRVSSSGFVVPLLIMRVYIASVAYLSAARPDPQILRYITAIPLFAVMRITPTLLVIFDVGANLRR